MNASALSAKMYVLIWLALMVLLVVTWGVAQVDLGLFNTPVAMGIAFLKMVLVVLFFMHVRYESKLTWIFVAAGLIWFAIMVDLTLTDYLSRDQVPGVRQLPQSSAPSQ
ncbi:MAG TPA: cytochrome C oxidase subunit IV family protein [Clostridia bacterium]|nr:cytochrome C oxidase subunit IV family protein [Clostridia bacterium]